MEKERIPIPVKDTLPGEDGYRIFSIRVKKELVDKLEKIASESSRSRNELIGIFLEYGVNNYEILR